MGTVILKIKPSTEPNLSYELRHSGVKGMKWGVRRYQNADGTLTDLGKHRYRKQIGKAATEAYDRAASVEIKKGKSAADADASGRKAAVAAASTTRFDIDKEVQKDLDATETVLRETGNASRTASGFVKNARIDVPKMDLSSMSDQDLRNAIARARLEGEYDSLFNPKRAKVERGRQNTAMVLDGLAAGTAIAGSALTVALMIKKLKGG